jgi:hypothetical protein
MTGKLLLSLIDLEIDYEKIDSKDNIKKKNFCPSLNNRATLYS